MKVKILGTGTSCGVPQIGCLCPVCQSADPRDRRLRCSALVETGGKRILIDCGPDFREQMLTVPFEPLDALLVTHEHYDHVGGLDDLRPFCMFGDVNVYAEEYAVKHLIERIPYCFTPPDKRYPGVPAINLITIDPAVPFTVPDRKPIDWDAMTAIPDTRIQESRIKLRKEYTARHMDDSPDEIFPVEITPIRVMHGKLSILGYRIGTKFAYITDMSSIDPAEEAKLHGVTHLVINGLRHQPHPSHQTIDETIAFVKRLNIPNAYIIHTSHHISLHDEEQAIITSLAEGRNILLAYDGMEINI